jgi:hypothetical protein
MTSWESGGVYKPCFLMVGLEMAQEVQDMI